MLNKVFKSNIGYQTIFWGRERHIEKKKELFLLYINMFSTNVHEVKEFPRISKFYNLMIRDIFLTWTESHANTHPYCTIIPPRIYGLCEVWWSLCQWTLYGCWVDVKLCWRLAIDTLSEISFLNIRPLYKDRVRSPN